MSVTKNGATSARLFTSLVAVTTVGVADVATSVTLAVGVALAEITELASTAEVFTLAAAATVSKEKRGEKRVMSCIGGEQYGGRIDRGGGRGV